METKPYVPPTIPGYTTPTTVPPATGAGQFDFGFGGALTATAGSTPGPSPVSILTGDPMANPAAWGIPAGQENVPVEVGGSVTQGVGGSMINLPPRMTTIGEAVQALQALSRDDLIKLQQQLWSAGFYSDAAGNPEKIGPVLGTANDDTIKAYLNALFETVRESQASGQVWSVDHVLQARIRSGYGDSLRAQSVIGIVGHGYHTTIDLTAKANIESAVDQTTKSLQGRPATDAEKASIVAQVQGAEQQQGRTKYAALEQMYQDSFLERVNQRDIYYGVKAGQGQPVIPVPTSGSAVADTVVSVAQKLGVDPRLALAIAQQESSMNPNAPGGGLFQLNVNGGEGAGMSQAQIADPVTNATVALTEVAKVAAANPTWSAGQVAAAAQRPFDQTGYAVKIDGFYGDSTKFYPMITALPTASAGIAGGSYSMPNATAVGATGSAGITAGGYGTPNDAAGVAVAEATKYVGGPYLWGGGHTNADVAPGGAVDCSGLVQQAFADAGINISGTAADMQKMGAPVSLAQAQPGDLVFYGSPAHHVGIYIGNGQMISAANTQSGVITSSVTGFGNDLTGIRRVVTAGTPARADIGTGSAGNAIAQGPPLTVQGAGGSQDTYIPGSLAITTNAPDPNALQSQTLWSGDQRAITGGFQSAGVYQQMLNAVKGAA